MELDKYELWMQKYEIIKPLLTSKQRALAERGFNNGFVDETIGLQVFTVRHHYVSVMKRLCILGLYYADFGKYQIDFSVLKSQMEQKTMNEFQ